VSCYATFVTANPLNALNGGALVCEVVEGEGQIGSWERFSVSSAENKDGSINLISVHNDLCVGFDSELERLRLMPMHSSTRFFVQVCAVDKIALRHADSGRFLQPFSSIMDLAAQDVTTPTPETMFRILFYPHARISGSYFLQFIFLEGAELELLNDGVNSGRSFTLLPENVLRTSWGLKGKWTVHLPDGSCTAKWKDSDQKESVYIFTAPLNGDGTTFEVRAVDGTLSSGTGRVVKRGAVPSLFLPCADSDVSPRTGGGDLGGRGGGKVATPHDQKVDLQKVVLDAVRKHLDTKAARATQTIALEEDKQTNPQTLAFLPVLKRKEKLIVSESEEIIISEVLSQEHAVLPEFRAALDMCCLSGKWLRSSKLSASLLAMKSQFRDNETLKALKDHSNFRQVVILLIVKAYNVSPQEAQVTICPITGQHVCFRLCDWYLAIAGWRQPFLHFSLALLWYCETSDRLLLRLVNLLESLKLCLSVQLLSFGELVQYAYSLGCPTVKASEDCENKEKVSDLTATEGLEAAKRALHLKFEDYVDLHKENAFRSAFLQPAMFAFSRFAIREDGERGQASVEVHAINSYAALLAATLQIQLPFTPMWGDRHHNAGLLEFWDCGADSVMDLAWTEFSKPENFGTGFLAITSLSDIKGSTTQPNGFFGGLVRTPNNPDLAPSQNCPLLPMDFFNRFADPSVKSEAKAMRVAGAKYVERFC